jgi:hypothetical protein
MSNAPYVGEDFIERSSSAGKGKGGNVSGSHSHHGGYGGKK